MADRRRRPMVAEDLFRLRWAMEPSIDSTGTKVAFVVAGPDRDADRIESRVHVVDVASGETAAVRSAGPARRPRWSPDGTTLAMNVHDGERWQLAVVDDLAASSTATGNDADHLAGTPALPTVESADVESAAVSPNATTLAVISRPPADTPWANRQLWLVDTVTGARRQLGANLDRSIGQVVRGDDERGLGPPSLAWTTDGRAVLAAVANGGTSSILAFDVDGSGWSPLPVASGAILDFDVARQSGAVAYTWSGPHAPGELNVLFVDGSRQHCSDLAASLREEIELAPTTAVTAESNDGQRIDGWLTMPCVTAGTTCPLVLQVHGGPHYPVGERFSYDAQRLAARGIAVLRANPRGSQGYGEQFAGAIAGRWGTTDIDDLLALVDHIVATHPVDEQRLAITGESYGGYVALAVIARTDRFAAAVAENCVAELDGRRQGGPSPVDQAAAMTTPLLLVHAEDDVVSPIAQSEAMAAALARCGRTVELVRIPGEGHFVNVTGRPSRRLAKLARVDDFLSLHLGQPVLAPT